MSVVQRRCWRRRISSTQAVSPGKSGGPGLSRSSRKCEVDPAAVEAATFSQGTVAIGRFEFVVRGSDTGSSSYRTIMRRGSGIREVVQAQRVACGTGKQWLGLAPNPGVVTGTVIGREKMPALATDHVKQALILMARRDHQALTPSGRAVVDTRHVVTTGTPLQTDRQPPRQRGNCRGKRMLNRAICPCTPSGASEIAVVRRPHLADHLADGADQELVVTGEAGGLVGPQPSIVIEGDDPALLRIKNVPPKSQPKPRKRGSIRRNRVPLRNFSWSDPSTSGGDWKSKRGWSNSWNVMPGISMFLPSFGSGFKRTRYCHSQTPGGQIHT
jgi:hypothetical protein